MQAPIMNIGPIEVLIINPFTDGPIFNTITPVGGCNEVLHSYSDAFNAYRKA